MCVLQDLLHDLIPTYLERIVLAIGAAVGWVYGVAFGNNELPVAWLLAMTASDYLTGIYRCVLFRRISIRCLRSGTYQKVLHFVGVRTSTWS